MVATVTPQDEMLVIPFVTAATFKAHPTYLDLGNLRVGDSSSTDQDTELTNMLLLSSAQVENFCQQPIQAHIQTDSGRQYADRWGRLHFYADDAPVRTVLSYSYGVSLGQMTTVTNPTCHIEDGRQITVELAGATNYSWSGPLQFGAPPVGMELFTTHQYVAGYANALLTNSPTQGATSITVSNPTGIFAGDTLRIWEPGREESVVVASSWAGQNTAPFTAASIPLVSGLTYAHTAGAGVTGFDHDLMLATIYYTIDGLQRWGTSSNEWPAARVKAATGKRTEDASAWEQKAMRLLLNYRRPR